MTAHIAYLEPFASDDDLDAFIADLTGPEERVEERYSASQPRIPGGPGGGRWTTGGALVSISDFESIGPGAEAPSLEAAQKIADYGAANGTPGFPTTTDALSDETLATLSRATPEEIAAGEVWYRDAHNNLVLATDAYGYPLETGCAITARCSAQRKWETNGPLAELVMKTNREDKPYEISQETYDRCQIKPPRGPGVYRPSELHPRTDAFANPAYDNNIAHASKEWTSQVADSTILCRAAHGKDPGMETINQVIAGPKLRNFYNNLHDPSDRRSVTIDSLQVRAMTPNGLKLPSAPKNKQGVPADSSNASISYYTSRFENKKSGIPKNTGLYAFFATGMQKATARANKKYKKHWSPQQLQAITWLVQRREQGPQGED